jgi:hypothetical protein
VEPQQKQNNDEEQILEQIAPVTIERIKRDELLKDTALMVALMVSDANAQDTIAPVELVLKRTRFWKSPIGFEGYKYDGTILDLFGVFEIQDVYLFKEKNELWMQIGRETIRAKPDNQYHKL